MSRYRTLSVDELLAEGARLETLLQQIAAEYDPLAALVDSEESKLKRQTAKLGLSASIATGGIIMGPLTFGWSVLTVYGPAALAAYELIEFGGEYRRLRSTQRRLRSLLLEAKPIADELFEIREEIDRRTSR